MEAGAARIQEMSLTNAKLEEAVASLVLELQASQKQNTETAAFLEESRASIALLRQAMEEYEEPAVVVAPCAAADRVIQGEAEGHCRWGRLIRQRRHVAAWRA